MSIWKAIFLGLLQGFTEFLPVSSSGHLAVAQNFFGFDSSQSVSFTVLLHLGTLAAVCIMYRRDVWMLLKGFFTLVFLRWQRCRCFLPYFWKNMWRAFQL